MVICERQMGAVMERMGREKTSKGQEDRSFAIKLKSCRVWLGIVLGSDELQLRNKPSALGRFGDQLARSVDPILDVAGSEAGSPTLMFR
jgi:hypothetical protein